jgi:O-methyltransferase
VKAVPKVSSEELEVALALRRLTASSKLRQLLSIYMYGEFGADEFDSALRIALSDNRLGAALAFVRSRTDDRFLRKLITYYQAPNRDPARFEFLLRLIENAALVEDLSASLASTHWMDDPRFVKAYDEARSIAGWGTDTRWRMHVLTTAAARASQNEGDFVECGTDRGGGALCVVNYVGPERFANRYFYLFDTFQGVVRDQMQARELELTRLTDDRYPPVLSDVKRNFAKYPFVRIVPGVVPDTLQYYQGDSVAFLHIDMNVAHPEQKALEFFWPRLVKGAPVIFDDYGFPRSEVQRRVLDGVAARLGTAITTLPTGQGILWR